MQKKLIALAIAGAFAAPAFAATSNIDFYGQVNLSVDRVDDGNDTWMRMVTNNNSFFGLKGTEDLGGGLSAVWQLETNVNFDGNQSNKSDSGNLFGTRNTFVGLSSKSFGTVVAGVHDTPYKMSTGPLDLFVGTLGDYNGIMGSVGVLQNNPSAAFDLRTGNTILYTSPTFSGFGFKAAYAMGGEGNDAGRSLAKIYSLSGTYANGPLFVTAAYEKQNGTWLLGGLLAAPPGTTSTCNPGATCVGWDTGMDSKAWKLGVSYKIGDFKLGAMYEKQDDNIGVIGHNSWMLNAAYAMGAFTFKGQYIKAGDLDVSNNTGAKMYALGMDYAMSKRTTVQLTYAKMKNDNPYGNYALGQGPQVVSTDVAPGPWGDDLSGFSLGIRHSF